VNACNVGGQKYTKLMAESIDGNVDKVKALLEVPGIDLNIQVERYTALMLAVNWGKTEVVKLLLADERCDALWTYVMRIDSLCLEDYYSILNVVVMFHIYLCIRKP